jgi:uncharacterized membrane protein (UPF0182 family)
MSTGTTFAALIGSSLAASVIFFLTTNFACWWYSFGAYPPTFTGLIECYTFALPFFRYTLSGDLLFALTLFSTSFALQGVWQSLTKTESIQPETSIAQ